MRPLGLYKTYSFRNKDPVIDQLRTVVKDQAVGYSDISEVSGVSSGTMYNWFHGATRRPQHASIMAVTRALGYDLQLVKTGRSLAVAGPGHNSKRHPKKNGRGK